MDTEIFERRGDDRLNGGTVDADDDVREEYETVILGQLKDDDLWLFRG